MSVSAFFSSILQVDAPGASRVAGIFSRITTRSTTWGLTPVWDRRLLIHRVQGIAENGPITTARLTNGQQLAISSAHGFVADRAGRDSVLPGVRLRAG